MKIKKQKFSTQLSQLYGWDKYEQHLEVGREYFRFWEYNSTVFEYTKTHLAKIKITYKRSGVCFFVLPDFPEVPELFFTVGSFIAATLVFVEIDPMKDLTWEGYEMTKEQLEKRYCFDDETTVVLNWDNSPTANLEETEITFWDTALGFLGPVSG